MFVVRVNTPNNWAYALARINKAGPVVWIPLAVVGDLCIPMMPKTLGE